MSEERSKEIRIRLGSYFEAVDAMATLLADTAVTEDQSAILDTIRNSMDNIRALWKEYSEVAPTGLETKKVIVVDDDAVQRIFNQKVLEKAGFLVSAAKSGEQALALLATQPFDLMVLDCQMPGIDGFQVVETVRANEKREGRKSIPVVALTEHGMAGYRERCLQAGMTEYRRKPLSSNDLVSLVTELTSSSKSALKSIR